MNPSIELAITRLFIGAIIAYSGYRLLSYFIA